MTISTLITILFIMSGVWLGTNQTLGLHCLDE